MSKTGTQKVLIVLGMHRSGTSALAGLLNIAGIPAGEHLLGPEQGDNEKGYWEDEDFVRIHDEILFSLNSAWDQLFTLEPDKQETNEFETKISSKINDDFSDKPIWMFKDPRACRLLPLWKKVLSELSIEPVFCIIYRHPLEVSASLNKRTNMGANHALLLWLQHNLEAERLTHGLTRVFIHYDELLTDWSTTLSKISEKFQLACLKSNEHIINDVNEFINTSLKHHKYSNNEIIENPTLSNWSRKCYELLNSLNIADNDDVNEEISILYKEFSNTLNIYAPLLQHHYTLFKNTENEFINATRIIKNLENNISTYEDNISTYEETIKIHDSNISTISDNISEINNGYKETIETLQQRDEELISLKSRYQWLEDIYRTPSSSKRYIKYIKHILKNNLKR